MSDNWKQYIIVNRGLKMSRGKLMAQASHAAMAWLINMCRDAVWVNTDLQGVNCDLWFPMDLWENWIKGAFTKIVLAVDSEEELNKLIQTLEENDFKQPDNKNYNHNCDFFVIRDNCLTELTPDETGTRMTCIGFKPSNDKQLQKILKQYPLFN